MNKNKVIDYKNIPAKAPVFPTLTTALALDYWQAPGWLWGALGLFFLLWWIFSFIAVVKQEPTDIFKQP